MKIMLIGGGELGREDCPYETEKIDKEIVKMSGKERPKLLFIGLASSYADSYYDVVKKVFMKLGCIPVHLKKSNLVHNPELVRKKIQEADIIYIGAIICCYSIISRSVSYSTITLNRVHIGRHNLTSLLIPIIT